MMIFATGVCFSFSGILSKLTTWSPLTVVAGRGLLAAIILGIARRSFKPKLGRGEWIGAIGLCGTGLLFMFANRLTTLANAIVLQYAMPIFVVLYCALVKREKPQKVELFAVIVMISGVCLCFAEGLGGGSILGDALALLSSVTYAALFLSARYGDCDSLDMVYLGQLMACCFLVFIPFDSGFSFTIQNLLVWLAMGTCLGVGYLLFALGMKGGISPLSAAVIANVEPVLNPTWAFLVLGENPGTLAIIGACIVLAAATMYSLLPIMNTKKCPQM